MPCFIFINGFMAKRLNTGGKLRANKILAIFWMYLLFKFGNVFLGYLFHKHVKLCLFKDTSATWYLLALCIWYFAVPALERFKTKYLISGSFLIGLFAGYIKSIYVTFSLSRVFVFFPFFILGFCLQEEKLEQFLNKRLRIPAILLLAVVFAFLVLNWDWLKPYADVIYGSTPYYKVFGAREKYGIIIRGIWYLLAITLSAAVMLLVPRCRLIFTSLGERTLQVYMTHIWVRNALFYAGFFTMIRTGPAYLAVLVLIGSVVLTFLLSNGWLKKLYDILMVPKLFLELVKND
jgi:fucose 4-O-acetylase-like acetyltransferase